MRLVVTPLEGAASGGAEALDRPLVPADPDPGRRSRLGSDAGLGSLRSARDEAAALHLANRRAAAIVLAFLAARLAFAFAFGFGVDEAYTLPISRHLSLSYFDHPPLHQWITHFAGLASGEGLGARLPFVALFAATGWLLYRLTSELFGPRAGLVALFGLNATPFFFASAGTWIMPDGPLLFGLALAAWALSRLFFDPGADERRVWRLWLLAGLGFGLAGLSKYIGALAPLGLLAFLVISPSERRWFRHPAPYVAAMLAGLDCPSGLRVECPARLGLVRFPGLARRRVGGVEAVAGPAGRAWADRLPVPVAVRPASRRPPLGHAQMA